MAKKKKWGKKGKPLQPIRVVSPHERTIEEAFRLRSRGQDDKAIELLRQTDRQHPGQRDVLVALSEILADKNRWDEQCEVAGRLAKLFPADGDVQLMLASSYLRVYQPILALNQFRSFLSRWPNHPRAEYARESRDDLEPNVARVLEKDLGVPGPEGMELGMLHEQIQLHLWRHQFSEVRRLAEKLLQRWPTFMPASNNLAEACFQQGNIDEAIAVTRRALEHAPDNCHAQGNLTRHLFLAGRFAEAEQAGDRLQTMAIQRPENLVKKAEAFSILGRAEQVINAWHEAAKDDFPMLPQAVALLHHLAAVAFCRLGNETEARRLWRLSLAQVPDLELASQNLRDLDLPPGEKNGPWSYSANYWMPMQTMNQLREVKNSGADAFIGNHPELVRLLPHLLERGDQAGRELAVILCEAVRTPELLALLRDFALGQHGSDKLRMKAAMTAVRLGALAPGMVRVWYGGEQREQLLMQFEIFREPMRVCVHTPAVEQLAREAMAAVLEEDGWRAERLLLEALAQEPDAPDLLNNLAQAYRMQHRPDRGEVIVNELHRKHPDYLFAAVEVARKHIANGQLELATELLKPFMLRQRLHTTEFNALAVAHIELALARNVPQAAQHWLDMIEQADPNNPQLPILRAMMEGRPRRWKR